MKLKHALVLAAAIAVGLPSYVSAQTATSATAYREQSSAAVSTPASGVQNVFVDSTTHTMYRKDSSGTVTAIGSSLPTGQVGYGNGTGITSSTNLSFDGSALAAPAIVGSVHNANLQINGDDTYSNQLILGTSGSGTSITSGGFVTDGGATAFHTFNWNPDGSYRIPPSSAAACSGCERYNTSTSKLQYSNDGVIWNDLGSGGGAISLTCGTSMSCSPSTITGTGSVSLNLGNANTWTASQNVASVALTYGSTISTNAALGNSFGVTLTGNATIANPTNLVSGGTYQYELIQDATGSRTVTWGSVFKWPGGTAPTLQTAASAKDLISCYYDGTDLLCGSLAGGGGGSTLPSGSANQVVATPNGASGVSSLRALVLNDLPTVPWFAASKYMASLAAALSAGNYSTGLIFWADRSTTVYGGSWYQPVGSTAAVTLSLWDNSSNALLASRTITPTAGAVNTATFATPYTITNLADRYSLVVYDGTNQLLWTGGGSTPSSAVIGSYGPHVVSLGYGYGTTTGSTGLLTVSTNYFGLDMVYQ